MKYFKLNKYDYGFFLLLALAIISKIFILKNFGFKYTGSDDVIFWQSLNDYSKGIFHEPYFYGQNYNYMLESIFAIPLQFLGIPAYISLPISTSFMGLFPFLFFVLFLYKNKYQLPAYLFLIIPITLPIEYDILTCVTRGFVNGIFFTSFLVFCLLNPTKKMVFFYFRFCFFCWLYRQCKFSYFFTSYNFVFILFKL